MVARALEREYGTDVSMEYIELSNPEARNQHEDIIKLARKKYMRFPVVMVGGEVVCHGSLDYYRLDAIIAKRLKGVRPSARADVETVWGSA